jgi:hypothetical protein
VDSLAPRLTPIILSHCQSAPALGAAALRSWAGAFLRSTWC